MSKGKREATRTGRHTEGDPFGEERRTKKPGKKRSGRRTALTALVCIAVVGVAVAALWTALVRPPDVSDKDRPGVSDQTGPATEGARPAEGTVSAGRKEDYYTFLLIGKDTSSGSTDTLILVSYDVPAQQVNMMSIPRDTVVNVPWSVKKINSVYSAKESSGGGLANLKKQVGYLTGVEPDFYVMVEWEAVGRIVEAVGGVDFYVPRNMNYDDPYQDLHIHLTKGQQRLTAEQAMAMLRYRTDNDKSVGYGDTGRTETQREFLKAMAREVLKLGNMTKIGKFIDIFMDNVETDLKLSELMWFASKAMGVDLSTMQSSTMPYIDINMYRGGYYFLADPENILPLVNEQFNPYDRDITAEDLQVVQRSKDGSCYVTNGELLDARWGKSYSSSMSATSSGTATSGSSSSGTTGGETTEPTDPTPPADGETTPPETDAPTQGETTPPADGEGGTPDTGTELPPQDGDTPSAEPQEPTENVGGTTEPQPPAEDTGGTAEPQPPEDGGTATEDSQVPGWLQPSE